MLHRCRICADILSGKDRRFVRRVESCESAMREVAVTFDHVWKSYPSYYKVTGGIKSFLFHMGSALRELRQRSFALEDMNLEIFKGENFGFVGRNGAGKSTTLGLIAGVLSPDRGVVTVKGRVSPLLELGAGFHPELTGRENILLNGVLMGLTRAEVREQLEQIIEFSGLESFIDQPVRTYSSGMFSKLGFAVVANLKPEILLLDEILSVGDIAFARKCEDTFEAFRSNPEVTIVLVSHGLDSVARICDRAAWVDDKTIRMVGPAADVVQAYTAAHSPKSTVSADIAPLPPHVWAGRAVLDCSNGPARLNIATTWSAPGLRVKLSLHSGDPDVAVQQWECPPQPTNLYFSGSDWVLAPMQNDEEQGTPYPSLLSQTGEWESTKPLTLRLEAVDDNGLHSPPTWLAVVPSDEAARKWEAHRGRIFQRYGDTLECPAPLWPENLTLRIVSRNTFTRDAVGNFALGVAGLASRAGLPVRMYAYVTCHELAGIVAPLGDLRAETNSADTVFYNWSIEDEFLPQIAALQCRKVLYFHNVTPGDWFREYNPEFADVLDRSRGQFSFFGSFDAVLANSEFSLSEITPYLSEGVAAQACAPCVDPFRLSRIDPAPVSLPSSKAIWLWVGRMAPHKRPETAITMFKKHLEDAPEDLLVMVGGGRTEFPSYAERIKGELDALSGEMQQRIVFLSELSDGEMAWLYRNSDTLLCTSGHEGFCLPIMEARIFDLQVNALSQPAIDHTLKIPLEKLSPIVPILESLRRDVK